MLIRLRAATYPTKMNNVISNLPAFNCEHWYTKLGLVTVVVRSSTRVRATGANYTGLLRQYYLCPYFCIERWTARTLVIYNNIYYLHATTVAHLADSFADVSGEKRQCRPWLASRSYTCHSQTKRVTERTSHASMPLPSLKRRVESDWLYANETGCGRGARDSKAGVKDAVCRSDVDSLAMWTR